LSPREQLDAVSARLGAHFATIAATYESIRRELQLHSDGKSLKGDEIVGWIGEVYAKLLLGGTIVSDSFEHDVEAGGRCISVKARKGWKSGWTQTSAIPKIQGTNCPSHLLFVHLNDDFTVDRMWLYPWSDMVALNRFKVHMVRGSPRSFIFYVNPSADTRYVVYPEIAGPD